MLASFHERIDQYIGTKSDKPKLIVIYWPTACGKTVLSLEVAKYLDTEIISADSRQIYRGLDIGTGKIQPEEMQWIPHHMLDVIDPSETFSMVDFARDALPIIERIQKEWKVPILCGGTGLYIDAVLYQMNIPDSLPDWEYRKKLEEIRIKEWNTALWNMLERVDPEYAHELEVNNFRYVMRWLEVMRETGRSKRESKNTKTSRFSPLFLTPYNDSERKDLYERINLRVKNMIISWLIDEVYYNANLFTSSAPGLNSIGYREVIDHLEGKITLNECETIIAQHNRNYAKRQITWNKRYLNL